jgi:cbb3-type cytochrome oxidase subunit 3
MSILDWLSIALSLGSLGCAAYAYRQAKKALEDAKRHVATAQALVRRINALRSDAA